MIAAIDQRSLARTRISVRPLREAEAAIVDRNAFETFMATPGLFETRDYVGTRRRAHPNNAFAAEAEGLIVGSGFVTACGCARSVVCSPRSLGPRHRYGADGGDDPAIAAARATPVWPIHLRA